jgi:hypothetical protein
LPNVKRLPSILPSIFDYSSNDAAFSFACLHRFFFVLNNSLGAIPLAFLYTSYQQLPSRLAYLKCIIAMDVLSGQLSKLVVYTLPYVPYGGVPLCSSFSKCSNLQCNHFRLAYKMGIKDIALQIIN